MSRTISILSPFTGQLLPIEEVPDPVFAQKMVGDGIAVEASEGVGVAPIAGEVVVFLAGGHAFALRSDEGLEIIVHAGLETVNLKGRGFTKLAEVGERVKAGQEMLRFDIELVRTEGYSLISPIVLPNLLEGCTLRKCNINSVKAGVDVIMIVECGDEM